MQFQIISPFLHLPRQLAQLSGVSAYLNPTVDQKVKSYVNSNVWRELMKDSITSQQINGDKLDYRKYTLHPSSSILHFVDGVE